MINQEIRNPPAPCNPCFHEQSQSWATSLPPDVGYDELIDIRTVQAPWPTPLSSAGLERRFGFGDGSVRNQNNSLGERGCRTSNREFDSDEASLWWYTYARMEGPHAMGRPHEVSAVEFVCGIKRPKEPTSSATTEEPPILIFSSYRPVQKTRLVFAI